MLLSGSLVDWWLSGGSILHTLGGHVVGHFVEEMTDMRRAFSELEHVVLPGRFWITCTLLLYTIMAWDHG